MKSGQEKDAVTRLKNLCARREYCSSDIIGKLRREGVTEQEAEGILQELREGKWVDDVRYAGCYAREKALISGWGTVKIRFHLRAKGIAPEAVNQALEEIESAGAEKRRDDVLRNKWRELCRKEDDVRKRRMKLIRFALGRGYSAEDAFSIAGNDDC